MAALTRDPRLVWLRQRLMGRVPSLARLAREMEIVEPAFERVAPPAFILDGQMARITAVQEETTLAEQYARLRGGRQRHDATVRFVVEDALLIGGDLYAGGTRIPLRPGTRPSGALHRTVEDVECGALVQTYTGSRYFGHWLLDDRPMHLLASQWGRPVAVPTTLGPQQHAYLRLFGQDALRACAAARCARLHLFLDVGQNPHRTARIEHLRATFMALGVAERTKRDEGDAHGRVVFVCRGAAGARRMLLNEDRVAARLERMGVAVIRHPERQSLASLAAHLGGAQLVVGMDSSGLAHAVLGIKNRGGLVVISPADRHNNTFKDWCDPLGIHYGVVIASKADDGYLVSEDELLATMDGVLAASSRIDSPSS